jgi:putative proteasome-type protease
MTYCLAISVKAGLVFASDSRTHGGVDQVSVYPKMHTFAWEGERVFVLLSAGNLATTQAVVKQLKLESADTEAAPESLQTVAHMSQAADYVGRLSADIQHRHGAMVQQTLSLEASFILGGQIQDQPPELFLIYPQGNHISASPEQPFLQIGEIKYGKPILDRVVAPGLALEDGARCALVSLDSAMRSNISVGPPIDLLLYERDTLALRRQVRLKLDTPYYASLRKQWNEGLKRLVTELPRFDWEKEKS